MANYAMTLEETIDGAEEIARDARANFGALDGAQLNWKPSAEEWSVGECFDHLITSNRHYFPVFEQSLDRKRRTTFWESLPLLPALTGRLLIKSLDPSSTRRLKAPAIFKPTASSLDARLIDQFVAHQSEVVEFMRRARETDPAHIIITSPVARYVTYSLLDAFRIIVTHERRHFAQARRVIQSPGFPPTQ